MTAILRRELIALLRTRAAMAVELTVALAFPLLILLRWPTEAHVGRSGAEARQVLRVFGYGLIAGIVLLVPAFPATSLVREKVRGTLALLLNTPLKPWSIYLGKLLGVLGFVTLLLLLTVPAAAACHALGGTSVTGDLVPLYLVLLLSAVQLAALALLVSSYVNSTDAALRVTYGLVLLLTVVTLGPYAVVPANAELRGAASWIRCFSPIPAVMEVLGQGDLGAHGLVVDTGAVRRFLLLGAVTSLAFALVTVARLNHRLFDRSRSAGVMTEDRPAQVRAWRKLLFLVDPQRRSGYIGPWANPVMVKEFRTRRFGRAQWMLRLIATCAIISLAMTIMAVTGIVDWGLSTIGGILVLLQLSLLMLIGPSLAAGLISVERESGGWQLLQMTPLPARTILAGKLLSVVWPVLLVLGATLPGYAVMVYLEPALTFQLPRVFACLGLMAVFIVVLGAALSSVFRNTAAATLATYLIVLGLCVGTMLFWLGRDAPFGHRTVEAALTLNPLAAALNAAHAPGFTQYDLLPAHWWFLGGACLTLAALLLAQTWRLTRPQ